MSQQETHYGKMKLIWRGAEEWCRCYCNCKNISCLNSQTWQETFFDNFIEDESLKSIIIVNDNVYEILKDTEINNEEIFVASCDSDNIISYTVSYYNGGCSFTEALKTALKI